MMELELNSCLPVVNIAHFPRSLGAFMLEPLGQMVLSVSLLFIGIIPPSPSPLVFLLSLIYY